MLYHLNPHGLHLNRQGTIELANNFKYFINSYDCLSKYNNTSCETAVTYDRQQNSANQSTLTLPKTRRFKLSSLNVRSLKKHIDEVKVLLFDISIDVLAINETRFDSTISDNEMHVPGYEIVRRDRNVNGRLGGGVCFYVRCNIYYSPRLDLSIDQIENLCIEIRKPKCKRFLVATWYRLPDSLISTFSYF